MKILGLAIQGFRSFQADEVFRFPHVPGLYFLSGVNKLRDGDSNGSGKSSCFDALIWVFEGKSSRNLQGPDLKNRHSTHLCSVTVDFEIGDDLYNLTRTWNPNALALQKNDEDPKRVTQEDVDALIRGDFDTLTNAVLMSQFASFFFDLKPASKLDVFSKLFRLDEWLERAKRAAKRAAGAKEKVEEFEKEHARYSGSLESLQELLPVGEKEAKRWESERSKRVQAAKEEEKKLDEETSRLQIKERKQTAVAQSRLTSKEEAEALLIGFDKDWDAAKEKTHAVRSDLRVAAEALRTAVAERTRLLNTKEGECPTCYQRVDRKRLSFVIKHLKDRIEGKEDEERKLMTLLERTRKKEEKVKERRDEGVEALVLGEKEHKEAFEALRETKADLRAARRALVAARKALQETSDEENPWDAQVEKIREGIKRDQDDLAFTQADLDRARRAEEKNTFWVKAFKDLRLWLIEQALTDFEVSVNNALVELGLPGWKILFDVEKTTKKGTVTKGFSVFIQGPEDEEPVRWESWCGGETQRLRLAGSLGLVDLVSSWTGFRCNIEVWDEPTQHLSAQGVADFLAFLRDRATALGKVIWVVDHNRLSVGDFDGTWTVERDERGSRILPGSAPRGPRPKAAKKAARPKRERF